MYPLEEEADLLEEGTDWLEEEVSVLLCECWCLVFTHYLGVGTGVTRPSTAPPRPESTTASSVARRGGSTAATGKYSHVKSSGYGPRQT